MTATRSELQAWLDAYAPIKDAPDAQTLADFLGIELAPEPAPAAPVGQRRRSPEGVEVIKTDCVSALCWHRYAGVGKTWFADDAVADWQIVTDAPEAPEDVLNAAAQWIAADVCPCDDECDSGCIGTGDRLARILADAGLLVGTTPEAPKCNREHLPSHSVRICLATISDEFIADLAEGAGSPIAPVADAAHRERERRRRGEGHASVTTVWSTELDLSPDANWEDATAEEEMA